MVESFYSRARRENRRIASYVTVFATPLSDKMAGQKTANVTVRSIYAFKYITSELPYPMVTETELSCYQNFF
jgi:hypothetical protein